MFCSVRIKEPTSAKERVTPLFVQITLSHEDILLDYPMILINISLLPLPTCECSFQSTRNGKNLPLGTTISGPTKWPLVRNCCDFPREFLNCHMWPRQLVHSRVFILGPVETLMNIEPRLVLLLVLFNPKRDCGGVKLTCRDSRPVRKC